MRTSNGSDDRVLDSLYLDELEHVTYQVVHRQHRNSENRAGVGINVRARDKKYVAGA